jgi:hypothetical protein
LGCLQPEDHRSHGEPHRAENEAHRRDWPDIFPSNHFAIADNGGGDVLLLGPDGDDVLFWDHETGDMTPVNVKWG